MEKSLVSKFMQNSLKDTTGFSFHRQQIRFVSLRELPLSCTTGYGGISLPGCRGNASLFLIFCVFCYSSSELLS